jgi:SRSO17 transposase
MVGAKSKWEDELGRWLKPFLDCLGHKALIADGVWDAAPLEAELLVQADRLVGSKDAVLVIDDTAMSKKGDRSVGVAPQYASSPGKMANCQTLVSLTLARGEVPVMVALRPSFPRVGRVIRCV